VVAIKFDDDLVELDDEVEGIGESEVFDCE